MFILHVPDHDKRHAKAEDDDVGLSVDADGLLEILGYFLRNNLSMFY